MNYRGACRSQVMDGNSRWARKRGLPTAAGHAAGVTALRTLIGNVLALGPPLHVLTVYAFSTENWGRSEEEVTALLALIQSTLVSEADELRARGVQLRFIGELHRLPASMRQLLHELESHALDGPEQLMMCVALSYGGRAEIARVARELAERVHAGELDAAAIDEDTFARALSSSPRAVPSDPDLLLRTGGNRRLSNFLLYQAAYAELVVLDELWPDFGSRELAEALREYCGAERTVGARHAL